MRCTIWARAPVAPRIFVKEVDDPENFGVVVYDEEGAVADIVEKAGVVDTRFDDAPVVTRRRWPLLLPAGRLRRHRDARAVDSRRARDHRRQPPLRAAGRLDAAQVAGWWEDAGKHWKHLADIGRRIDETGANKRDPA